MLDHVPHAKAVGLTVVSVERGAAVLKLPYDEKAFDKRIRNAADAADLLTRVKEVIKTAEPFEAAALEQTLKAFVEQAGLQISSIVHPLRVALTGKAVGFGLFDTMAILGREQCLSRIDRALAR